MARFPAAALLDAGFLKTRCSEPCQLECPACGGPRLNDGSPCSGCYAAEAVVARCLTCKERLLEDSAAASRACLSRQAYDGNESFAPIFSRPEDKLWGLKVDEGSRLEVVIESELARRFASGELEKSVLVSEDGGATFQAAKKANAFKAVRSPTPAPKPKIKPVSAPVRTPVPVPAPAPDPVPEGDGVLGERRARRAVWASLFTAIAGAHTLWQSPWIDLPSASIEILIAYGVTVLLVWFAGLATLMVKDPAHASLRWWSPLAWAFMTFAWPGAAGLAVAYLIGVSGLGFLIYTVQLVLGVGLLVAAVCSVTYGGAALTMRPPWPKSFSDRNFRALRSRWVWLALVATLALNVATGDGSGRLLEGSSGWGGASTGLSRKPLIEKVDKKPSPTKDMNGFARATLADIAEAVNNQTRLSAPAAPGVLPQVDASVAALAGLPRPPAGDRARAKELTKRANQLMAGTADWSAIADLMSQAHAADPQDAEVLNFLAYAQMQSGRHAQALTNIIESLRLAPTSANGWNRLAQIRLATAKGDPRQIQEASRYYVVFYWLARDRPRVMRYFNGELTAGPGDSPDNPAAISLTLERLRK